MVESDAGVDQGDSLAPVLFAFGVQGAARALEKELKHLAGVLADNAEVVVLLYLDDVYIFVPQEVALHVLPLASTAVGCGLGGVPGYGLTLRDDKCVCCVVSF